LRVPGRLAAGAAAAAALLSTAVLAEPAGAQPVDDQSVTVVVQDMSPTTPAYSATASPLTITLALTNTTDETLYHVTVAVDRDAPVTQQKLLEQLMAKPAPSGDHSVLSPLPPLPVDPPLNPHETRQVTYRTTTSSAIDNKGICLCFNSGLDAGVYPINFTVSAATDPDSDRSKLGFGQTYLPAFKDPHPTPVQVSWVWPLIDRPHRLVDGTFLDDDLAASVSSGGRLDRALAVVEKVAPAPVGVHVTLVIDPELLDELVMMSKPYVVVDGNGNGAKTAGTGTAAAKAWLQRLQSVVASTQVSLTAYADPDVDALSRASLAWSANFGAAQATQVQAALGIPAGSDVAWPPGSAITSESLQQILRHGSTSVVVLNDATLPGAANQTPRPDALAPLPAQYGVPGTVAAVTDHAVQALSDRVLSADASGTLALPQLVSELAVRGVQQPDRSHYVVITASRYVDVNPDLAARALQAVTRTPWSTSLRLDEAARTIQPVDHGQLVEPSAESGIPATVLDTARSASEFYHSFTSALSNADASSLIGDLPAAIQRTESAAWRADPARGSTFAGKLAETQGTLQDGVHILRPSSGSYTLASNDSPLPITIINTLPVDVRVRVSVTTTNGVTGFRSDDQRVQTIPRATGNTPARSTLKIQTHVQRAGTFQVNAVLLAPDGSRLGAPVALSIHCTALGAVGVIITAVAGGVLVLALGIRVYRRIRARRAQPAAEMVRTEPAGITA
jgi:hypothetical protein